MLTFLRPMQISEHIERLVNFLKREEGPETTSDGIQITTSTNSPSNPANDSDDEDNRIEEI